MDDSPDHTEPILLGFLFVFVMAVLFEVLLLSIAFFGADRVECTLLWCTFTTERTTIARDCFVNGERVDCGVFGAEAASHAVNGSVCWNGDGWGCK